MSTIGILISVFLLTTFICCAEHHDAKDETQTLLDLEHDWLEKEFALDTAFLSSIMDSSFISISETGVNNKHDDLVSIHKNISDRLANGIVVDSFRLEDHIVKLYSSTAVVTFVVHTYRHAQDSLIERRTRFYDVWVKRGDQWKAVASQGTAIAK